MDSMSAYPLWQEVYLLLGKGLDLAGTLLAFGCNQLQLTQQLGIPDSARQNFDGEVELLYGGGIFRLLNDQFVECTFPDTQEHRVRLIVDGTTVLSVYQWLSAQSDCIDVARFRVSCNQGIAYDRRSPEQASYTLFAPGHWDALVAPLG